MPPLLCCLTCHQPGTSCRVPTFIPRSFRKHTTSWNCWAGVIDSDTFAGKEALPLRPDLRRTISGKDLSVRYGTGIAPRSFQPLRLLASKKSDPTTSAHKTNLRRLVRSAQRRPWERLAALAMSLAIAFGSQPALADFKSALQADLHEAKEVIGGSIKTNSSISSVEAILAKQLARRFRDMSDEELIDILQQLLKASRSSFGSRDAAPEEGVPKGSSRLPWTQQPDNDSPGGLRSSLRASDGSDRREKEGDEITQNQSQSAGPVSKDKASGIKGGSSQRNESSLQAGGNALDGTGKPAEGMKTDGQVISQGKARETTADGTSSEFNEKGTSLPALRQEEGDADGSGEIDSRLLDATRAADIPKYADKVLDQGGGNDSQPENATELLLAEWSRRVSAQPSEEMGRSTTNFDLSEVWRKIQNSREMVSNNVVIFSSPMFEKYRDVVGVVFICILSIISAFYFGRSRSTSSSSNEVVSEMETSLTARGPQPKRSVSGIDAERSTSRSRPRSLVSDLRLSSLPSPASTSGANNVFPDGKKEGDRFAKDIQSLSPSTGLREGVIHVDSSGPVTRKWWQKTSTDSFPSRKEEPQGRRDLRDLDVLQDDTNQSGKGRQLDRNNTARLLKSLDRRELGAREQEGFLANDSINPLKENLQVQHVSTNASVGASVPMRSPERSSNPSTQSFPLIATPMTSKDQGDAEDHFGGHGNGGGAMPGRIDAHDGEPGARQVAERNFRMNKGNFENQKPKRRAVLEEDATIPNEVNVTRMVADKPARSEEITAEGKGGIRLSAASHARERPTGRGSGVLNGTKTSPGADAHVQTADTSSFTTLRDVDGKDVWHEERYDQGSATPQTLPDNFVHRGSLWIRDSDGVFLRQSPEREVTVVEGQKQTMDSPTNLRGTYEAPEQRDHRFSRTNRSSNGFNYRHWTLASNGDVFDEHTEQVRTTADERHRPQGVQTRPLKFTSDGRNRSR